jgi:hypothetical protein
MPVNCGAWRGGCPPESLLYNGERSQFPVEAMAVIIISAGMQKAASASHFNLINNMLVAAGNEDVHVLRERFGFGFFMSRVNCNVGPLRFYKLAWLSLPHWIGQSFVVKTHEGPGPWLKLWSRLRVVKPTYIYRDPREVAVSLFAHGESLRRQGFDSRTKFDQLKSLEDAIRFTARLLPIWRDWTGLDGVLAVRFEDFTANLLSEAERLNRHLGLGLAADTLHEIATRMDPRSASPTESHSLHTHAEKRRPWQSVLSSSQQAMCLDLFGPYLKVMGY